MTTRFVAENLDLSRLPPPEVVRDVSYETILAERLASLKARFEAAGLDWDVDTLETDPAVILQQEDAWREALAYAEINDRAKSMLLAFAQGADLEHLAARIGVERLVITPATDNAPAVMESDEDLRHRTLLAPEALPYAGMTGGGYRALARRVAPSLKDVQTIKRPGGRVDVVLLSRDGDGSVPDNVVDTVYRAFQDDEATQLTDVVAVRSADIITYSVELKLFVRGGPDQSVVRAAARTRVLDYVAGRHRIANKVHLDGIGAAAFVGGVETVEIEIPEETIDPGPSGAAYCAEVTVTSVTAS